ncbi:hypothetical protein F1B92_00150 [Campylobacter sp. FMV-PI01]|uniref:L-seryl-tRNA selenium transferase n=1 Tax=Campylobacter portucalensis TaxID=2608384 RepID=A0A6L5WII7_9BACT|nr:hypothetical protein [Campylobacter portucalensis]MSN95623.1 hypothetical protein [Campylobacter portucalensis]
MKKIKILFIFLGVVFLVGCSTKREYFNPADEEIIGKISVGGSLENKITHATISGATLKNGMIITKNGLLSGIKLDKNEKFLGKFDGFIISSNFDGNLKIRDKNSNEIFSQQFPTQIVSAALKSNLLALVSADNSIFLIDIYSKQILLTQKFDNIYAIDSRVATPLFLYDTIVYPTLDGRVVIVNKNSITQDVFVSTEFFFNNIIFLENIGGNIYAATNTNLVLISPNGNKRLSENIKDILIHGDRIYVLRKDGIFKVFDLNLNEIFQNKFKFAIFSAMTIYNNYIYIFEKTGYLIKIDLDFKNTQIYRLSDELDERSFIGFDKFYYDNKFFELK